MSMHNDEWTRLGRYFAGECNGDERLEIEQWIHANPAREATVAQLREVWERATDTTRVFDENRAWDAIVRRKAARSSGLEEVNTPSRDVRGILRLHRDRAGASRLDTVRSLHSRKWIAAAAILLMTGTAVIFARRMGNDDKTTATAVQPMREYSTERGQRAEVRLADGSTVTLAAQSRLRIPADFDNHERHLFLEGEAYFDVIHNAAKPFTVSTGKVSVHDIGTRFDVRAYHTDASVRVLVTQGKVQLVETGRVAGVQPVLSGGQLGSVRAGGGIDVVSNVDTTRALSWTSGGLAFERTPVRDALADIARWYDVDVKIDPRLAKRTVTTVLSDQPLTEVLDLLALALDARVERAGRNVTLVPRR